MHRRRKLPPSPSRRDKILAGADIESVARRAVRAFIAEPLESRLLFNNTIHVINLNDSGNGSLRNAITTANSLGGTNLIDFPGLSGTINLNTNLPFLSANTTINGPGASVLTINGADTPPIFESVFENKSGVTSAINNLTITGGVNSGIFNLGTLTITDSIITRNFGLVGGGISNYGTLTLTGSTVSQNNVDDSGVFLAGPIGGGGIFNEGALTINSSTITGNSASNLNSEEGGPAHRGGGGIFNYNGQLSLYNSTLFANTTSNYSGGGVYSYGGTFNATGSSIISNSGKYGGGIDVLGSAAITNCRVNNNSASMYGGGIFCKFGLTITNSTINGNSALFGGGIFDASGALSISGTTIDGNTASGNGAGIFNGESGALSIGGSTLSSNVADSAGGAIFNLNALTVTACTISGDLCGYAGGGIYSGYNGVATIIGSSISDNMVSGQNVGVLRGGGGIFNKGRLSVSGTVIDGNSTDSQGIGGGIANFVGGTATLSYCTINTNYAAKGGGLDIQSESTVTVTNSTLSGNIAANEGGGVAFEYAGTAYIENCTLNGNSANVGSGVALLGIAGDPICTLTLANTTITGNTANSLGGGLYFQNGTANVFDCTISANSAASGAGGAFFKAMTVSLNGTILAANPGGDLASASGLALSGLHDLIGDGSGAALLSKTLSGTPANPLNPMLAPLGNYGGPTKTMALLPGSPAINAGRSFTVLDSNNNNILNSDQRGASRPSSLGFDIGAYQSGPLIVNTLGDPSSFTPGILSLREAIAIADAANGAVPQTIIFSNTIAGTIGLASSLQNIGNNITIDGPGAGVIAVSALGHGSVFTVTGGGVTIENLTITCGNSSFGGGIFLYFGGLTLANSTITGNAAGDDGGGIYNESGTLNITDCTITSNTATGDGGGVSNHGGIVTISYSTISSNRVFSGNGGFFNGGGGAIYSYSGFNGLGALTITDSTIAANQCGGDGGAISNNYSTLTVVNTTITGNIGAMGDAAYANGPLTFIDDTISNNLGSPIGAFIVGQGFNQPTTCFLDGTIIAGNHGPNSMFVGFNATLSGSNDLLGDSSDNNVLTSTIRNVFNPLLSSLDNFGGPTQTLAILPGSPAIGSGANFVFPGINIFTDQRGIGRPQGAEFDIGAYEIQRSALVVNTISDAAFQPVGSVSLRDAIASATSIGGNNTITFQSGLNGTINLISSLPSFISNISVTGPGANIITINGQGQGSGPVFFVNFGITSTIQNLTITGGIYNGAIASFGSLTVSQSTITGSFGTDAGALYCRNGTMAVNNCTLTGNSSFFEGGAILNNGYTSITNTTISGSRSEYGGAICNTGTMVITGSTISGNTAGANGIGSGGGIYTDNTLSITNCTITGNLSNYGGGAVENFKGSLTITDSTITANSAAGAGKGIDDTAGSITLNGSIIAADSGTEISIKNAGTLSGSNDLIGDGSDAGVLLTSLRGTIANPLNPLLLPLASNGGPTQTLALLGDSPAIAHGAVFAAANGVDQRGNPRPAGSVDIGAFQTTVFTVNTLADPSTISPGVLSLRQAITQADAAGFHPIISFAAGLTGTIAPTSLLPAVSTSMQINGPGVAIITVNLSAAGNLLTINPAVVTQLNDLTLTGGSIADNGSLNTLDNLAAGRITGAGALTVGLTGMTSKLTLLSNTGASTQSSLTVNTGSTLDITNNRFLINFGAPANDPISTIKSLLTTGYNSGVWTGAGIDSSIAAAGSPGENLAVGYADGNTDIGAPAQPNQIVVRYTFAADASLDGLVNFQDLVAVIQNFNKTNTDWSRGNFGYGNSTNFLDLVAVVQNFNKTLTPPASSASQIGGTTMPLAPSSAAAQPRPVVSAMQNQTPGASAPSSTASVSPDLSLLDNDSTDSVLTS